MLSLFQTSQPMVLSKKPFLSPMVLKSVVLGALYSMMFIKTKRSLLCLCLASALSILPAESSMAEPNRTDLPDMGTVASSTLSISKELQYGDAYMRILRATQPIINDPVMNQYLDDLGHRLVAHADNVKTPFQFILINNHVINAFAFFGGHVALHSGLFLHTHSESELASVMAHEISHITQRHLARRMEDEARNTPATVAAIAGSLLLAIASPQAGIAAINATMAGHIQGQLNYSRSNEQEADRFGMRTLEKSGFNVMAMPNFFSRLAAQYRYSSKPPQMLLTHPLPQSRITDTRQRAQQYQPHHPAPSLSFYLAKARVIARYSGLKTESALDWFSRHKKNAPTAMKPAFDYGQALVYLDTDKLSQSKNLLMPLWKQDPDNPFYLDAMSDLYLALKEGKQAQTMLSNALENNPKNAILLINYANVLYEEKNFQQAIHVLQRYTHTYPSDVNGWDLLSKANSRLGNEQEVLAARGEILALKAQWTKAIQYYTQASQLAKLGSLEQARYDARIDQLLVQRDRFTALQKN